MEWINVYHFWATERGCPIKVKPIKYIGLKGWDNYIYRKLINGIYYAGEIWLCEDIFGDQKEYIIRVEYSEDMEEYKTSQQFKSTNKGYELQFNDINAHTDGYDVFITKNIKLKNNFLLKNQIAKLETKIAKLTKLFKELNNIENQQLKLGVQLYLRRLETPTMQTSREWREYGENHPYLKSQILDQL